MADPVFMYGPKNWLLNIDVGRRIDKSETKFLRRLFGRGLCDHMIMNIRAQTNGMNMTMAT
jgi:hypothetical protein